MRHSWPHSVAVAATLSFLTISSRGSVTKNIGTTENANTISTPIEISA